MPDYVIPPPPAVAIPVAGVGTVMTAIT